MPDAALGGVLLFVALRIIRLRQIVKIARQSLGEFLLVAATAAAIIVLPIEQGVAVGIALSLLHVAQINADAARRRIDLALERGAGAERDHGHAVLGANSHHVLDVGGFLRHHDRVRRLRGQPRGGMGMVDAGYR